MARHEANLGFRLFATKQEAIAHFKAMLGRYAPGETVSADDAAELEALLSRHPEASEKAGSGITGFGVRAALYGTTCFEVRRTDGSTTDFSYLTAVNGKPSPLQEMLQAMRAAVQDDIRSAKRDHFARNQDADGTVVCAITKRRVTFEQANADHAPPKSFALLAKLFLSARSIVPSFEHVTKPRDNQYQPELADPALAEAWRAFHHREASLRIVAAEANLRTAAAARPRKADRQLNLPVT
jgi:hypothetical protein